MKGFIEVTTTGRDKYIINIIQIISVRNNGNQAVITTKEIDFSRGSGIGGNVCYMCVESYNQIKELIKQATVSS